MITIYGMQSPHVARVRAALLQKGLEFQHVSVNIGKSEEFNKITPVGKIPVMEDSDGTVVWDSLNIIDYLDKKYPSTYQMFDRNPQKRAKIFNVIALVDRISEVLPPFYIEKFNVAEGMVKSGYSHRVRIYNDQEKADARKDIESKLKSLNGMLNEQNFFTDKFSVADAAVLAEILSLEFLEIDVSSWKKWSETLMKDEKISKMFPSKEEKAIKEI